MATKKPPWFLSKLYERSYKMWCVKEQSKKSPSGKQVSPVMETQSGAESILKLMQDQARNQPDAAENPKHYFIAQYIKRGKK